MLPHTTSAVSAFPEDDVGCPTQFASKTGVGTTGLFLCSNAGGAAVGGGVWGGGRSVQLEVLGVRLLPSAVWHPLLPEQKRGRDASAQTQAQIDAS